MAFPWAKLYTEILDDHIVRRLTDPQFRLFINLILLARDLDEEVKQDGRLDDNNGIPLTQDDLAWRLRLETHIFDEDLAALMVPKPGDKPGLISLAPDGCFVVTAFGKRQARRASDMPEATKERKRKQRDGQKAQETSDHEEVTNDLTDEDAKGHDPVTTLSRRYHDDITTPDLDSDSDSDTESEPEAAASSKSPLAVAADAAALRKALRDCRVAGPSLAALLADPWVTPKRVNACWLAVQERKNVRSRVGLLVQMLRDHDEPPVPPPRPGSAEDRYKYIRGEFAEHIEY